MPAVEGEMLWILRLALPALLAAIYFLFVLRRVLVWNPFHLSGPDDSPSAPMSFITRLTAHGNSPLEVQWAVQLTRLRLSAINRPRCHRLSWTTG